MCVRRTLEDGDSGGCVGLLGLGVLEDLNAEHETWGEDKRGERERM